jgi:hypothetical protein
MHSMSPDVESMLEALETDALSSCITPLVTMAWSSSSCVMMAVRAVHLGLSPSPPPSMGMLRTMFVDADTLLGERVEHDSLAAELSLG